MMTVATMSGVGLAHAWQVGTPETLCGATIQDMRATGSAWPPIDGEVCRACVRSHRLLLTRSMWASVDAWLTPAGPAHPHSRPERAPGGRPTPHQA